MCQQFFSIAFFWQVVCMNDYDYTQVKSETLIIAIASTFGNGDPPENGRDFLEILSAYAEEGKKSASSLGGYQGSLNNL